MEKAGALPCVTCALLVFPLPSLRATRLHGQGNTKEASAEERVNELIALQTKLEFRSVGSPENPEKTPRNQNEPTLKKFKNRLSCRSVVFLTGSLSSDILTFGYFRVTGRRV